MVTGLVITEYTQLFIHQIQLDLCVSSIILMSGVQVKLNPGQHAQDLQQANLRLDQANLRIDQLTSRLRNITLAGGLSIIGLICFGLYNFHKQKEQQKQSEKLKEQIESMKITLSSVYYYAKLRMDLQSKQKQRSPYFKIVPFFLQATCRIANKQEGCTWRHNNVPATTGQIDSKDATKWEFSIDVYKFVSEMNRLNNSTDQVKPLDLSKIIGENYKKSKRRLSLTYQCRKYYPESNTYGEALQFISGKTQSEFQLQEGYSFFCELS